MDKRKNKVIVCLGLLVFMLSVSSLFNSNYGNYTNDSNLEISDTNYLFRGKEYNIELNDVYDDENYTKIYTGANFQTNSFNSTIGEWNDVINNETVSPVNNTISKSPYVNGHYPATYSFENDIDGSAPDGWTEAGTGELEVISDVEGHKKIMNFKFPNAGDYGQVDITSQTGELTIEFWVYRPDLVGQCYFRMMGTSGGSEDLYFNGGGGVTYYKADASFPNIFTIVAETWYHIKIELDVDASNNIMSVWVDGVLKVDEEETHNDTPDIGHIRLYRGNAGSTLGINWDAFGFSWDPYYTIGDNLYSEPISMIDGTFDNTDNMKANDGSNSEFTSEGFVGVNSSVSDPIYPESDNTPNDWSIPVLPHWSVIDGGTTTFIRAKQQNGDNGEEEHFGFPNLNLFGATVTEITVHSYAHRTGTLKPIMDINLGGWVEEKDSGFWDNINPKWHEITWSGLSGSQADMDGFELMYRAQLASYASNYVYITYIVVSYSTPASPAELNYTIDLNFNEVDTSKLLALDVSSHHYTNISTDIIGNIYDYDSSSYTQMFSSSNTVETENYFSDESSVSNYLNSSGNLRLYFTGFNSESNFKHIIDYIKVRFYYKMDLTHTISFETNGLWKYRWELIGSLQYTDWTFFEVVDPEPNFHAISESDKTTRWILQGSDISPVEDFNDDINTDYWNLVDVSERVIDISSVPTDDSYIDSHFPDSNYGNLETIAIGYNPTSYYHSIFKQEFDYLYVNYTSNSTLYIYTSINTDGIGNVYHTYDFNELTITWDNQPITGTYQGFFTGIDGWNVYDIGAPFYYYKIISPTDITRYLNCYSSEKVGFNPIISHYLSKNYFGGGYMYMQTNTTELISLESTDYGNHHNLSSSDYFEIDFQTSSDSKIELILLKDGEVNKTLILSASGNTNFNRHTVQISVDEFVEFDQLKISSTFEDTDNVKVYDIKTYKYTLTGDSADFIVGSKRTEEIYLTPDIYNLRIFDPYDDGVKVNVNITIPETGIKQYLYTPTESIECRITLFSLTEDYLQFEDYHVRINQSLNGQYRPELYELTEPIFYADKDTKLHIYVYDRFDVLIYYDFTLVTTYFDLYIEVYSLKIRNEATDIVDYTLQNTDTGSSKSGLLFSDEIIEYHVKGGNYSLDYTNYEDMYPRECNFEITNHRTITINTTYHTVYIGLFTYDGMGIDHNFVRLYINDERKDFGFNVIDSETAELVVLDFFNNTIANETIDPSAYSEYNLYAEIYSMIILNQFTYEDIVVNITQVGSGIYMTQIIPKQFGLYYRFLPNVEYNITVYFTNETLYASRIVNLTDNSHIESFGIATGIPEYPKNVYFGVYTTLGLGIDHDLLKFYLDNNRTDFGFNRITDEIVNVTVKDYFNTLLFTQMINTSGIYEYDILITLYTLQIKNLQLQQTTVDINSTLYEGTLLSDESIYFLLSEKYYEIGYYDTNNDYKQFLIYLDSNQAYEINRSQICFLIYADQQGNHLVFENYKTYLNGSRTYINNFYREIGDIVGIEIKDRYDISIKNETLTVVSGVNEKYVVLTMYSLKVMSQQLCFNHINITRDPNYYESDMYWSEWIAPSEIIDFRLFAGYYVINITNYEDGGWSEYEYTLNGDDVLLIGSNNTIYNVLVNIANVNTTIGNQITNVQIDLTNQNSNINNTIINIEINLGNVNSTLGTLLTNIGVSISNIETSIISEITSLSTEINNINSSISDQILSVSADLININSSIMSQILTLGVDISNINGSIINQIVSLGVDITNINTSLSNQILSVSVDISNLDTSITDQIVLMVADIENVNSTIYNQTLVMLADISNVNTTLLNQIVSLGVEVTNINVSITNQILSLSVDLTNINSSISNLLTNIDISITTLQNEIGTFFAFTNTSFINLNNVMNTSFINIENNIFTINTSISNLVIGVSNDIYLINGTISTMITSIGTNLLLMNVSIDTSLFTLGTTLNLIGVNITSNFILLNNSINLTNLNVNDSRIAIINNLLIINNTMSTLIANVYSAVYLVNNSIYTAVVDLGTYLNIMNNTISGNLSIVLQMNEFLTEIYQMTMFSSLLNWTDIGLNITLLTSQIDAWEFVNNYKNQSVEIHLRYQDLIDNLTVSAQNTLFQYLPNTGVEYRRWSNELQEYIGKWTPLPENRTVNFGFYEVEIPITPRPLEADFYIFIAFVIIIAVVSIIIVVSWAKMKSSRDEVPEDTRLRHKRKRKVAVERRKGFYDHT